MESNLHFLSLDDLDDHQLNEIKLHLNPSERALNVTFPWSLDEFEVNSNKASMLNVHSLVFKPSALEPYQPSHIDYNVSATNYVYPSYIFSVNNGSIPLTVQSPVNYPMDGHLKRNDIIEQSSLNCNAEHFVPRATINNTFTQSIIQTPVIVHNAVMDLAHFSSYQKIFPCESNASHLDLNTNNNMVPVLDSQNIHPYANQSYTSVNYIDSVTTNSEFVNETGPAQNAIETGYTNSTEHECCDVQEQQFHSSVLSEDRTNVNATASLEATENDDHSDHLKLETQNESSLVIDSFTQQDCPIETSTSLKNISDDKQECAASVEPPSHGKSDADNVKTSIPVEPQENKCENQKTESLLVPAILAQPPVMRSFADVLKSKSMSTVTVPFKPVVKQNGTSILNSSSNDLQDAKEACFGEDKASIALGRYLHQLQNDFTPVLLQPRGLINRRTWCYINATLQALLACSPVYTLLRNLPIGPAVDRGKSSTPIIDSMVSFVYQFVRSSDSATVDDLQFGSPFQPDGIYDMLCIFKSHCLKGLQEDAEEFLSFILNGMHEEMVAVLKYYERKFSLNKNEIPKQNGHVEASYDDNDEEWQVIGAKQRGMVTRNVAEHSTPISNLLGGQIKSFLTSSTTRTASVQPFFTLQLDIQSDNVNSVEEALSQMTVKEPIQGYVCPKIKQEVEAYSHILLQKLPPILILHLKRFVYNKTGGCKKVMKHTEYPMQLELKKELFSPEAKKAKRLASYKLFAVTYHDGVEAVQGHYISDIYHNATKSWLRYDDSTVTSITEMQVFSHSPPRVPYLLFYQAAVQTQ